MKESHSWLRKNRNCCLQVARNNSEKPNTFLIDKIIEAINYLETKNKTKNDFTESRLNLLHQIRGIASILEDIEVNNVKEQKLKDISILEVKNSLKVCYDMTERTSNDKYVLDAIEELIDYYSEKIE